MKKIGIIILLVFSFILLTNCNKDKKEEKKNERISFSDESYKSTQIGRASCRERV